MLEYLWGLESPMDLLRHLKHSYHYVLAHLGALIYKFPSSHLFVIGVTGTKGKTSTVELINAGLEAAGYKTALNSSLRRKIGDESVWNSGRSMPGRFYLQQFLREALQKDCKFAIVEVTSEGVAQHRHRAIDFDAGVFLNLKPEHIESHGSFTKYKEAKLNFFRHMGRFSNKKNKYFFINKDDESADDFIRAAENNRNSDGEGATKIVLYGKSSLKSNLLGEFNQYNVGAAEAVFKALVIPEETVDSAIADFKVIPGRLEEVLNKPFKVYVDYAHTPDSLEAVYKTLSPEVTPMGSPIGVTSGKPRLICVLGAAGGGRDKWKRPEFGRFAGEYCDEIILTDEDPYDENPATILEEIESGIKNTKNYKLKTTNYSKIIDRKEAIRYAISLAKPGDTVIMTGKGSENTIHIADGKTIPWSEKEVAMEVLRESKVI